MGSYKHCLFRLLVIMLLNSRALCENGMILTSNLASTSRDYACATETMVITCSGGIGRELVWYYNGQEFLFDNNTKNPPQTMLQYIEHDRVVAYLTNRSSVGNGMYQYTSQLLIERIDITSDDPMDVICTVTSDPVNKTNATTCTLPLSVRKSAVPDAVMSVDQLGCVGINETISHYLLKWMPPDNINDFDLSHYEVTITGPSTNLTMRCIDTSTIFQLTLDAATDDDDVSINIVAVNQCGQRNTSMHMIQLKKCKSPVLVPNSSEFVLKVSASLWAALFLIAMILPSP